MTPITETKRVLFIGQWPETVDFSDPAFPPGFDAEKIRAGIAIGMQLMAERGREYQTTPGLGWIAGEAACSSFAGRRVRRAPVAAGDGTAASGCGTRRGFARC